MTTAFHNTSTAQLVDEYAELKIQVGSIEKRLTLLKAEMLSREVESALGFKYELNIKNEEPMIPDEKALKEYLGQLWKNFLKPSPRKVVRYKPLPTKIKLEEAA